MINDTFFRSTFTIIEAWVNAGTTVQTQTWTHDAAGQLRTAQDADGSYALGYAAASRVTTVAEPFGLSLTFTYDGAGNRTRVDDSKGGVTTVTFDAVNRQSAAELGGTGVTPVKELRSYTADGHLDTITRQGTSPSMPGFWQAAGTTSHAYDAAGRVTGITTASGRMTAVATAAYAYDAADRLTSKTDNGTTTNYSYDVADQLTADGATGFSYDATGNRTNAGYATGAGNRVSTDGVWTYTYDAEGNVAKKSKGSSSDTWVYAYDNNDQMTGAAFSATDGGAATQRVTYAYDAFNNRVQRQAWDGVTATTTRYGLDAWDPAKAGATGSAGTDTWADLDGSNALVTRYTSGPGLGAPVSRQTAGGTVSWYATDRQGSVRAVLDTSGSVTQAVSYDAFGKVASGSLTDRYAYAGGQRDSVTGLQSHGNGTREYDPATSRWLQEDPLGFAAGDPNLRRYAGNGSTNATDPSGLDSLDNWRGQAVWEISKPSMWDTNPRWNIGAVEGSYVRIDFRGVKGKVSKEALAAFIAQQSGLGTLNDGEKEIAAIEQRLRAFVLSQARWSVPAAVNPPAPAAAAPGPPGPIPSLAGSSPPIPWVDPLALSDPRLYQNENQAADDARRIAGIANGSIPSPALPGGLGASAADPREAADLAYLAGLGAQFQNNLYRAQLARNVYDGFFPLRRIPPVAYADAYVRFTVDVGVGHTALVRIQEPRNYLGGYPYTSDIMAVYRGGTTLGTVAAGGITASVEALEMRAYLRGPRSGSPGGTPLLADAPASGVGRTGPASAYFGPNDFVQQSARAATPLTGYYDVFVHGNATSVELRTATGAVRSADHRALARLIEGMPDYRGQPIRLISCDTGQLPNGFAQNLSNKLGVEVLAPNTLVWPAPANGLPIIAATPSGQIVVFQPGAGSLTVTAPTRIPGFPDPVPTYPPTGQFNPFQPGGGRP